jgi:hypothetical protein
MTNRRFLDPWSDDDPAIRLMREALALRPVEAPPPASDPEPAADATADAAASLDPAMRRTRIAELKPLAETGDTSALAALRRLLVGR